MRVTEKTLYQQSLAGLQSNLTRLQSLQSTLATGKRINRPSDDPSGAAQTIRAEALQQQMGQFLRNAEAAQTPLKVTDATLAATIEVLGQVKAVALSAVSGGATPEERAASAVQVQHAFSQLVQLANTTFNGQHIFSGFATDTPAYSNAGVYQGDGGAAEVELAPGTTVARNLPGDTVFGPAAGGVDIFARLSALRAAIAVDDKVTIKALLAPLGDAVRQVAERQAEVGVRLQEIGAARKSIQGLSETVKQARAGREDADMAQVVTEFQVQSAVLEAVRQSTARVLQTSLLDFLR